MLIDEQLAMAIRSSHEHDVARAIAHPGVLDVVRAWRRSRRRAARARAGHDDRRQAGSRARAPSTESSPAAV